MIRKNDEQGFTLIEMALVLVLGGLMVGAVLKGQTMIDSFRVQRLAHDLQSISMAVNTYFNMYNALPGDDSRNHGWNSVTTGNSDGVIQGNSPEDGTEAHEAWQALRWAGLIIGDPEGAEHNISPPNPYGGQYYLSHKIFGRGLGRRNCVQVNGISGRVAESIDIKYDDGRHDSGIISASEEYTSGSVDLFYAI